MYCTCIVSVPIEFWHYAYKLIYLHGIGHNHVCSPIVYKSYIQGIIALMHTLHVCLFVRLKCVYSLTAAKKS